MLPQGQPTEDTSEEKKVSENEVTSQPVNQGPPQLIAQERPILPQSSPEQTISQGSGGGLPSGQQPPFQRASGPNLLPSSAPNVAEIPSMQPSTHNITPQSPKMVPKPILVSDLSISHPSSTATLKTQPDSLYNVSTRAVDGQQEKIVPYTAQQTVALPNTSITATYVPSSQQVPITASPSKQLSAQPQNYAQDNQTLLSQPIFNKQPSAQPMLFANQSGQRLMPPATKPPQYQDPYGNFQYNYSVPSSAQDPNIAYPSYYTAPQQPNIPRPQPVYYQGQQPQAYPAYYPSQYTQPYPQQPQYQSNAPQTYQMQYPSQYTMQYPPPQPLRNRSPSMQPISLTGAQQSPGKLSAKSPTKERTPAHQAGRQVQVSTQQIQPPHPFKSTTEALHALAEQLKHMHEENSQIQLTTQLQPQHHSHLVTQQTEHHTIPPQSILSTLTSNLDVPSSNLSTSAPSTQKGMVSKPPEAQQSTGAPTIIPSTQVSQAVSQVPQTPVLFAPPTRVSWVNSLVNSTQPALNVLSLALDENRSALPIAVFYALQQAGYSSDAQNTFQLMAIISLLAEILHILLKRETHTAEKVNLLLHFVCLLIVFYKPPGETPSCDIPNSGATPPPSPSL